MVTISKECKDVGEAMDFIEKIEKKKNCKDFRIYMKSTKGRNKKYVVKVVGNIDI